MKESKEKAKTVFGGLFGKVSMYGDKEGVVVFSGNNPRCFFDVKVSNCVLYLRACRLGVNAFFSKIPTFDKSLFVHRVIK